MKILTAAQMHALDAYTVEHEPISSIDLMERAAMRVTERIVEQWTAPRRVVLFAGSGNNGGDALAVARLLARKDYEVEAYLFNTGRGLSPDCETNRRRLKQLQDQGVALKFEEVTSQFAPPRLDAQTLVVDGLFGTGLNRPLTGGFAAVVKYINASASTVVAIDMPSGLMADDNSQNIMDHVVRADQTYTFHAPKQVFFFPENETFLGSWEVLDIGLMTAPFEVENQTTEAEDIAGMLRPRPRFAHKGTMGSALLVAGRDGMAGAAVLAARATLRSGVGKLYVRTTETNRAILQISVPEAVLPLDATDSYAHLESLLAHIDAIAVGPAMGTDRKAMNLLNDIVEIASTPLVIDADAITLLAQNQGLLTMLPAYSILTPHRGELERLAGPAANTYELLGKAKELARTHQLCFVVKGAYTAVVTPEGNVYFNTTGNPGMATAGSGDVLTGIILGLLARGYEPVQAARMGVYLHGMAGDIAARHLGCESLIASDLVTHLPEAFQAVS